MIKQINFQNVLSIVLWLDCDKEGENICFEVINSVNHVMRPARSREQTIFRAKFCKYICEYNNHS